ncbi:MAG TPA: hypothetical protein VHE58_00180 [Burkholderiales bacterium]|nr:hypothetical protein [Burkholderiales bacterium]
MIGGSLSAIEHIKTAAEARAVLVNLLPVGVAAHTSLLAAASKGFEAELRRSALAAPTVPVLAGIDSLPVRGRARAIEKLSCQISTPIDWIACMEAAVEMGCKVFLELGPGYRLARMARDFYPGLTVRSVEEFRSLSGVIEWVHKHS